MCLCCAWQSALRGEQEKCASLTATVKARDDTITSMTDTQRAMSADLDKKNAALQVPLLC